MILQRLLALVPLLLVGLPLVALAGNDSSPEKLPWDQEPFEFAGDQLTLRAAKQLYSGRTGLLSGFAFDVENGGSKERSIEVHKIELLSARLAPRPWMKDDPKDRQARIAQKTVAGCWVRVDGKIQTLMNKGQVSCHLPVPPGKKVYLMVRFAPEKAKLSRTYWRRGVFRVDDQTVSVTGKLTQITFSESTIKGELKTRKQ